MDNVMESKLLDFNLDKSCYIVIGNKEAKARIQKELKKPTPYPVWSTHEGSGV